jgi:large subunit ribosomal protein L3
MKQHGLIAQKIGMTRMLDADGQLIPVTLLKLEHQKVTKILSAERDGYVAYQVGYFAKAERKLAKPDVTRLRKSGIQDNYTSFKEFRLEKPVDGMSVGSTLDTSLFEGVTSVDVSGLTKGRGFSGAVKRWNTAVGRMTHGSMYHRRPGSLGMRTTPGRVFKGKHIPGHYGNEQVTIQNLDLVDIDKENNVIALKGSVPGHRHCFLVVKPSIKAKAPTKKA